MGQPAAGCGSIFTTQTQGGISVLIWLSEKKQMGLFPQINYFMKLLYLLLLCDYMLCF